MSVESSAKVHDVTPVTMMSKSRAQPRQTNHTEHRSAKTDGQKSGGVAESHTAAEVGIDDRHHAIARLGVVRTKVPAQCVEVRKLNKSVIKNMSAKYRPVITCQANNTPASTRD